MVVVEVATGRRVRGAKVALAAVNLSDDAGSDEDIGEVFLQEAVLVHKEVEDFERLGAGQMVVAVFEKLEKEGCIENLQKKIRIKIFQKERLNALAESLSRSPH